jgi:pyridoxal phosphate enzyme (YggS family)
MIAENLKSLSKSLPEQVQLIAVSKTKPMEALEEAYAAGQRHFGENRIQEMSEKFDALPKDIHWHMIGNVQDNKIKYMAHFVSLVHGMDKEKRLKTLNKEAAKVNRVIDCLVQIHIAEEETKFGFDYQEAELLFQKDLIETYPNIRVRGLMGMATFTDNQEQLKREFQGLSDFYKNTQDHLGSDQFNILSMGMSGDYPLAIEQGSNMIRVGTKIFGARN